MAHHLGRARLTAASPPRGPGKTPLGDEALPVGCHTETIVWTVLGHRLRRLCSVPQEIPYTNSHLASFKRETVYRFSSHIRRTHITTHSQPGIDPFIGHPSRNGKMPVYRAPCICSPIHRDTTTSITRGPSAKPPHPSFFGIAKRRISSRY